MKMQFVGVGSAFTTQEYYQSNVLVIAESGKKLLIDCGSDARFALQELNIKPDDLDGAYVSHLHADHVGGLEWLAFCTYFNPNAERPKLYCNSELMPQLWEQALRGGLESIQGKVVTLTEYFECVPIPQNESFYWENIEFTPVQTVHVMAGYYIKYSYGLLIQEESTESIAYDEPYDALGNGCINSYRRVERKVEKPVVFFTTDTQFCPNQIKDFYNRADIIFHDCETFPFKSGVHAHYEDLKTLDKETKEKMWLYHYQPNPSQDAKEDGFAGFVQKGQVFEI